MSATPVERLNAALEGRYKIERELGEGGMANVYLADDLRHERKVALKVLKPELAAVVGAERFLAEIKTTANLQHPHILPLFDSGEADSFLFYVMPYVEGESLRERLDREHQLPVDEAVEIARNVAEALDYAHRQGVIHRDIKPANILLQAGKPVVSDFGIALAVGAAGGGRLTETGLSLGTPHYMSPEQATGDLSVGAATDIYALACVLYEMLVGEPPYTGSTPQAILGKIIAGELISATKQRATVPPNVDGVLRRALEKIPADRFANAAAFAGALSDPGFRVSSELAGSDEGRGRSPAWVVLAVSAFAAVLGATTATVWLSARQTTPEADPSWFDIAFPELAPLPLRTFDGAYLDVSPDGRLLVYDGGEGLYLRSLDTGETTEIPGTEGARAPTFSPDGESIAFLVGGSVRRVSLDVGTVVVLAEFPGGAVDQGLNWTSPDEVVLSRPGELLLISASSGSVRSSAARCDEIRLGCWMPDPLPGGEWLLVSDYRRVAAVSLQTGERRVLLDSLFSPAPKYIPGGFIAYFHRPGQLFAARLDTVAMTLAGPAVPVLDGVYHGNRGAYAVSARGDLVYVPGPHHLRARLAWVTRDGIETLLPVEPASYGPFTVSPDGSSVAAVVYSTSAQIFRFDLLRSSRPQTLTSGGFNEAPVWSPDGTEVAFVTVAAGGVNSPIRAVSMNRPEDPRVLVEDGGYPYDWSTDFGLAVVRVNQGETGNDIWLIEPESQDATLIVRTGDIDDWPRFSPDGTLLAYGSGQDGVWQVFVEPLPQTGERWQLSTDGGSSPVWSPEGDALYYLNDGAIYEVDLSGGLDEASSPRVIAEGGYLYTYGKSLDLAPDGDRFMVLKPEDGRSTSSHAVYVQNWVSELNRLVPSN